MSSCVACKSLTSNERCPNRVISGIQFCGKHVRAPNKRLWHVVNHTNTKVILIQKMWRAHSVRFRLKLAGPGVLKRELCHNEEDVVTFESKYKQHPFDFFSFEEDGKVWWFDTLSIIGCLNSALRPTNPYTRQPLTQYTRRRLRAVYKYRIHNRLPISHQPAVKKNYEELIDHHWMKVVQIIHENGFEDVHPNNFTSLGKPQVFIFLNYLVTDMSALAMEHPVSSRRYRWLAAIKRERDMFNANPHSQIQIPALILSLLNSMGDEFHFCFILMSALYRV
jgi:hypothetical protein